MKTNLMSCLAALTVTACGLGGAGGGQPHTGTTAQPVLSGEACALYVDAATCNADTVDGCHWVAIGAPCAVSPDGGTTCPPAGSCAGPSTGGGGSGCGISSGGGTAGGSGAAPATVCSQWSDSKSCDADAKDNCYWFASACPEYILADGGTAGCNGGACVQNNPTSCDGGVAGGGGGSSDAGVIGSGCACAVPAGGQTNPGSYVCVEQTGGPAQQGGQPVSIACALLTSNCTNADPCQCVTGEGHCQASPDVSGLCICNNGIE